MKCVCIYKSHLIFYMQIILKNIQLISSWAFDVLTVRDLERPDLDHFVRD